MMVMQELATMKKYNIPVIVILVNNSCWMAIRDLQEANYGTEHRFANDFVIDATKEVYSPKFKEIAENFGIYAQKISQVDEVEEAINNALMKGEPSFIEVDTYREYPESGAGAYGWWDVPVPTYMPELRKKYEEGLAEEQV